LKGSIEAEKSGYRSRLPLVTENGSSSRFLRQQQFPMQKAGHLTSLGESRGKFMGLMDALRKAERKGKELARRGVNAVEDKQASAEDAQRRARQKMRVYPERGAANPPAPDPLARELEDAQRKAIVSVHGEDLDEDELGKGRKVA
jgi:hypothetical protein